MTIHFDRNVTRNLDETLQREWLETNGLGGWASSTLIGCHTRRYHGLLVAATTPPVGRLVLLSKLDETLVFEGNRFELGCNRFPGVIHPRGYNYLESFARELFPVFEYAVAGIRLRKTIAACWGENTTLVLYEVLAAPRTIYLELRPFVAARDFHGLSRANNALRREVNFANGVLRLRPYDGVPEFFVAVPGAHFSAQPAWYYNFEYSLEQQRGLDFQEDLFMPGFFVLRLAAGDIFGVIVSCQNPAGRDAAELLAAEKQRRIRLFSFLPLRDDFAKTLTLAADQFVVRRGEDLRTIIAGYHWFADWGRDTMIALPGLCLATGRSDDAKKILRAFAQNVSAGMLPNNFPDTGEAPAYNTADATLWFFVAIFKYWQYTGDAAFVRDELLPVLHDIVAWHDRGTRYNIHIADDGLLYAGEPGVQLTWMDAKVDDWVVTPRQGKAVEINALWYNALAILAKLSKRFGMNTRANQYSRRAEAVKQAFVDLFWNETKGALYDCIDGDYRDPAIRPNQIFALSLPFPLLTGAMAKQVLQIVEDQLYTPVGLRSLAAHEPGYRPTYDGDQRTRDSAYHQGTVWSWLLGPFISAVVRFEGDSGRARAKQMLERVLPLFTDAGIGTVSEIFDGEPPHRPRGCIAQAWSVGELLRAYVEDVVAEPTTTLQQK